MSSFTCLQCGGKSNHFSRSRNAMVCDTCGSILRSEEERNADISFERKLALARQHLQVGNWDEVKRLVEPFCSSRPTDKQLYLMLLMAVTKGYSDFLFEDETARREAFEYWDKLARLGCINNTMRSYARKKAQYLYEERSILATKKVIAIGISSLISFIGVCLVCIRNSFGVYLLAIATLSWLISIKNIQDLSKKAHSSCSNNKESDNPFS